MSDTRAQEDGKPPGRQPIFLFPTIIAVLGGLMLAAHIAVGTLGVEGQNLLFIWFGFVPLRLIVGMQEQMELLPLLWTPVTHAFLHANWEHLLLNLAWFAVFGTPVARRYGAVATTGIFLLAAVAGAAAFAFTSLVLGLDGGVVLIGASGGVSGLTGAAVRFIFQPVLYAEDPGTGRSVAVGRRLASLGEVLRDGRARFFTLVWVAINAAVPLFFPFGGDIGIAWQAHLGGFFCGLLLVPLFERRD